MVFLGRRCSIGEYLLERVDLYAFENPMDSIRVFLRDLLRFIEGVCLNDNQAASQVSEGASK